MKCPTCGGNYVPPGLIAAEREWRSLPETSREAVKYLLTGYWLHGSPGGRGWDGLVSDALEAIAPKVEDAKNDHGAGAVLEFLGLIDTDGQEASP